METTSTRTKGQDETLYVWKVTTVGTPAIDPDNPEGPNLGYDDIQELLIIDTEEHALDYDPEEVRSVERIGEAPEAWAVAGDLADVLEDCKKHMQDQAVKAGLGNAKDLCPCFEKVDKVLRDAGRKG